MSRRWRCDGGRCLQAWSPRSETPVRRHRWLRISAPRYVAVRSIAGKTIRRIVFRSGLHLTAFEPRRTSLLFLAPPTIAGKQSPGLFSVPAQSRSMRFSLRSRSLSRRSPASCAGTLASCETARTHVPGAESPIPKSDATWRRVRPLVSALRTASRLTSSLSIAAISVRRMVRPLMTSIALKRPERNRCRSIWRPVPILPDASRTLERSGHPKPMLRAWGLGMARRPASGRGWTDDGRAAGKSWCRPLETWWKHEGENRCAILTIRAQASHSDPPRNWRKPRNNSRSCAIVHGRFDMTQGLKAAGSNPALAKT